jgi:hypothetical protein
MGLRLPQSQLVDERAEVWVVLEVADATRDEVRLAQIDVGHEGGAVDELAVDARPEVRGGTRRCGLVGLARRMRRSSPRSQNQPCAPAPLQDSHGAKKL